MYPGKKDREERQAMISSMLYSLRKERERAKTEIARHEIASQIRILVKEQKVLYEIGELEEMQNARDAREIETHYRASQEEV
jgi:hypothetical protein